MWTILTDLPILDVPNFRPQDGERSIPKTLYSLRTIDDRTDSETQNSRV
jgi:hypothetical protein